jgi:hypothetical protein
MIDIAELRATVATALASHIGSYTFSGGQTVSAIRVDDGSDPYDEEPQVTGLEVVIRPNLEIPVTLMMGGYRQDFSAIILLKQWDIQKTTLEAMQALMPYLAAADNLQIGTVRRVTRNTKLDNIETLSIQVTQSFLTQSYLDD